MAESCWQARSHPHTHITANLGHVLIAYCIYCAKHCKSRCPDGRILCHAGLQAGQQAFKRDGLPKACTCRYSAKPFNADTTNLRGLGDITTISRLWESSQT
jgi:hypothetical protein